jgi:prepilin-type N-terminal cleavage/methylation domain-containing protein
MVALRKTFHRRHGFTLVELLVVMAIIVFLAGILVALMPSLATRTAEANGAANLQGWLSAARQKAIRNQNPYGLRLWVRDKTTMAVTDCAYIEQPDDFTGGTVATTIGATPGVYDTVVFTGVDLTNGFGMTDPTVWLVQPGDFFEILGSGLMHRITAVTSPTSVTLLTGTPYQITNATNYRILRQARVATGETLSLPEGVIIDLNTNATYGNALPPLVTQGPQGASIDILFSPSGAVITPGLTSDKVCLWVRLPDQQNPSVFAGTPTIIAVFASTGYSGAYPPVPGATPYIQVQ